MGMSTEFAGPALVILMIKVCWVTWHKRADDLLQRMLCEVFTPLVNEDFGIDAMTVGKLTNLINFVVT